VGFDDEWLAARRPYDEAALDRVAVEGLRARAAEQPGGRPLVVVDLGSGTGAAIGRVRRWLAPREIVAYAVDRDADLLARAMARDECRPVVPVVGDLLDRLDGRGGPRDGTVDLVVGHALADLLPLDRLADRVAALARPGGLVHLALAYDGLTEISPVGDVDRERAVITAFHRHMDRARVEAPDYGGSTAGRRLGPALASAGLEIVRDAPSVWEVRAIDGCDAVRVLSRLIRFVVEAAREIGGIPDNALTNWERDRLASLDARTLSIRVGHRDVLARAPGPRRHRLT
jgi:SAM-dependent methyltransferase